MTYFVPAGNWTNNVEASLGQNPDSTFSFEINNDAIIDPAINCQKEFTAQYKCGTSTNVKSLLINKPAEGHYAVFDCSPEVLQCDNLKLALNDNGTLVLSTIDGKTVFWHSSTNGNHPMLTDILPASATRNLPNDNNKPLTMPEFAGDGIPNPAIDINESRTTGRAYIHNYLLSGQLLKPGQWIGSPSGTCRLVMGMPNLPNALQVVKNVLGCNTLDISGLTVDVNGMRLYKLPDNIHNDHIGKVGYINNDGQLQLYPDTMTSYEEQFEKIAPETPANGGYTINGAHLGTPFHADTAAKCKESCAAGSLDNPNNNTTECAGVIFDVRATTINNCQLLDSTMSSKQRIINNNYQYYIRQKGVSGQDVSCPAEVQIKNSKFWTDMDLSANMTASTKCGLANFVSQERNNVSLKLPSVYNNLKYKNKNDANGNELKINYLDASANPVVLKTGFKFWYESLQYKYAQLKNNIFNTNTSIETKLTDLQDSRQNLADWTGDQLQNLEAMNEDRDLNMMSQNYRHIMWSILAIIIIIGTIKFTKSSASVKLGTSLSTPLNTVQTSIK